MKQILHILRALVVLLGLCAPALAQDLTMGVGALQPSVFTYTGPGDVVAGGVVFYGLRAYNASYATAKGNAAGFTRSSDSATCTAPVTTRGDLDIWGTFCTGTTNLPMFCAGTSCFATTMYDQGGGGHNLTGGSFTPQLIFNCFGNAPPNWTVARPCLSQNQNSVRLSSAASAISTAQPLTVILVAERTGFTGVNNSPFACGVSTALTSGSVQVGFGAAGLDGFLFAGTAVNAGTVSDFQIHSLQYIFNGASSAFDVDGVTTSSLNPNTGDCSGNNGIIALMPGQNRVDAFASEAGIWSGAFTGTQLSNMRANQKAYWGTP